MENKKGFGAIESEYDHRTVMHKTMAVSPLEKGGIIYDIGEHLNQWYEGICTATWIIQNREKKNNKKYSYDFQYLLQKKYYDMNWDEGSSIFNALKVAKNYGFLPESEWNYTTIEDLKLPYNEYIAKLQAIPDSEIQRLIGLCGDKIAGYAQVDVSDPQAIARAIVASNVGIGCRFEVGPEWYNPSTPLLPPGNVTGAHAIGMTYFDYVINLDQKLANSWGDEWCENGNADTDWTKYKPTEAWIILETVPVIDQPTLRQGSTGDAVKNLQTELGKIMTYNFNLVVDGQFGPITKQAVILFQTTFGLATDGIVGKHTWNAINMINIITQTCIENGVEPELGVAVAVCESGLNPKSTLYNPPSKSTDRGLYQWNSVYHAEISDAQAFDPKTACELFCNAVKVGHLHEYWSASQPCWSPKLSVAIETKYGII